MPTASGTRKGSAMRAAAMAARTAMPMVATSAAVYFASWGGLIAAVEAGATTVADASAAGRATDNPVATVQCATGAGPPAMPANTSRTRWNSRDLSKKKSAPNAMLRSRYCGNA